MVLAAASARTVPVRTVRRAGCAKNIPDRRRGGDGTRHAGDGLRWMPTGVLASVDPGRMGKVVIGEVNS